MPSFAFTYYLDYTAGVCLDQVLGLPLFMYNMIVHFILAISIMYIIMFNRILH